MSFNRAVDRSLCPVDTFDFSLSYWLRLTFWWPMPDHDVMRLLPFLICCSCCYHFCCCYCCCTQV